ncbi:MAG: type II secretion system protein GspM [Gallionella sp.]|nr:type II secretion system protein GspM [Gallionella sp.]
MMRQQWEKARIKVDDMSLRERVIMFVTAVFVLLALLNTVLLDPLLAKQKKLSDEAGQQEEQLKAVQAQMEALVEARQNDKKSPLRQRIEELKAQLKEQDAYLQTRRDRLVESGKMAELLEQVLTRNGKLQLVELKTLPVGLLIEKPATAGQAPVAQGQRQIYKHGVQIKVRGGYLELLRYLAALEQMPAQMFWGEASLSVEKHPDAVMTLTLYTLSWDKIWLTV